MGVRVLPLNVPETVGGYLFAKKVYACARAEELAGAEVRSLVWLSPDSLIVQPPRLFNLSLSWDAAVRPVHIQNIGLLEAQPVDDFWKKIYETAGVADILTTIETFVDRQRIRAYFNSHALAANPARGLFRRWFECFESLACDQAFQAGACQDEIHQIFLHQSILSALIVTVLAPDRIRMLPPTYNYPYNLHESVPVERRATTLNELVNVVYEDRSLNPNMVDDIHIHEPLKSWLLDHAG